MRPIPFPAWLAAVILILALSGPGLALAAPPIRPQQLASTGTAIDDTVITGKIKAAYLKDPLVGVLDIHVDTYRGMVTLDGTVNTEEEKTRAATLARSVEGVREVKNNIQVRPPR
jgi:hyperosmotically inducible protein